MTTARRKWLRPLAGLVVTGFFLWLLFRQTDLAGIGEALSGISPLSLLAALGFLAAGYTCRVFRWWLMLRKLDPGVTPGACGWPFLVSIALNNLLPFRAGDAVRVMGFRRQLRAPAMRLLGTLVIERLLDLMVLLTFFFVGLWGVVGDNLPKSFIHLALWIAAAGLITVLVILVFSKQIERKIHSIADHGYFASRGWSTHLKRQSSHFLDALCLLHTPRLTLHLLGLSLVVWCFEGAVFATVAHALNAQTPFLGPWFALATGTLATLLPSSPGYIGTFDYFTMLGMLAYGMENDQAAAFAVTVHLVLWLPLTLIGMAYFLRPGGRSLRNQVAYAVSSRKESG
ncbi:MAG: flippase-like domain-containing protein [Thiogranum sp.]|nr:flippase-like domain-containing protein [Thiogranum sp.]